MSISLISDYHTRVSFNLIKKKRLIKEKHRQSWTILRTSFLKSYPWYKRITFTRQMILGEFRSRYVMSKSWTTYIQPLIQLILQVQIMRKRHKRASITRKFTFTGSWQRTFLKSRSWFLQRSNANLLTTIANCYDNKG